MAQEGGGNDGGWLSLAGLVWLDRHRQTFVATSSSGADGYAAAVCGGMGRAAG